jgi:hypothetical protein
MFMLPQANRFKFFFFSHIALIALKVMFNSYSKDALELKQLFYSLLEATPSFSNASKQETKIC